jgi:hypothetical protein
MDLVIPVWYILSVQAVPGPFHGVFTCFSSSIYSPLVLFFKKVE